jgi:hypothetical protein
VEVELTINLLPNEDGTAVLTVEGPTEGVVSAYALLMNMLQAMGDIRVPESDDPLGTDSVG